MIKTTSQFAICFLIAVLLFIASSNAQRRYSVSKHTTSYYRYYSGGSTTATNSTAIVALAITDKYIKIVKFDVAYLDTNRNLVVANNSAEATPFAVDLE